MSDSLQLEHSERWVCEANLVLKMREKGMLQTGSCPEELPVWQRGEQGGYKPYSLSTWRSLESKGQYEWNDLDISPGEVPHQGRLHLLTLPSLGYPN